jgi:hypothetical protein
LCSDSPLYESWVASAGYKEQRQRSLIQTAIKFAENGGYFDPRYSDFSAILKMEKGPSMDSLHQGCVKSVPRVIQAPHDLTHVLMGPVLKSITYYVEHQHGIEETVVYSGGKLPSEMRSWLGSVVTPKGDFQPGYVVALENDYSMFDSTIGIEALEATEKHYTILLDDASIPYNKILMSTVFSAWNRPHGYLAGLEYQAPAMNASGRDDTSLLNFLLNGIALSSTIASEESHEDVAAFLARGGQPTGAFKMAILGDDSLTVSMKQLSVKNIESKIARYGFTCTPTLREDPLTMVYLAHHPLPALKEGKAVIAWAPTLGRSLYKCGCTLALGDTAAVVAGSMEAWTINYPHEPILQMVASWYLAHHRGPIRRLPEEPWKTSFHHGGLAVAPNVWKAYQRVYGVTQQQVQEFGRLLYRHPPPTMVSCVLLNQLFEVDSC